MFKRRKPLTTLQKIRELCWPSMGWIRACKYAKHRIIRLSDSSQKIALGLAIGMAVSFSPILGTHFIQAGLIAHLLRVNLLAALIGTFIGNPWTFPFIWWGGIKFGGFLFTLFGMPVSEALPDDITFSVVWDLVTHDFLRLFLPWMLGGYLLGLISIPLTYPILYRFVRTAKRARSTARKRTAHRVAKQITGQKK